jgi:hypothetical protein
LRLIKVIVLAGLLLAFVSSVLGDTTSSEPARLLPARIGKYVQARTTPQAQTLKQEGLLSPDGGLTPVAADEAEYAGNGARVFVEIVRFRQDAEAYELLSLVSALARGKDPAVEIGSGVGTAGYTGQNEVAFFKGTHFVRIRNVDGSANLNEMAQALTEKIDKGEADIPALIKHLPSPEEAQKNAIYLNTFADLNKLGLQQPVLTAISAGGNADAVLAGYGSSKVLIVEFNTPQLAKENDERIISRIHELWKLGQPAPTAYRRVGNYSVFVFDAPDEPTAKRLIDEVKYEQVVQWLGENPNIYKEASKRYVDTTLGVLVAVVKASGYALVGCLGIGALIGGLLFSYRRAQQKGVTFSDAGGMLRLNLDELTAETNPARLLRDRN